MVISLVRIPHFVVVFVDQLHQPENCKLAIDVRKLLSRAVLSILMCAQWQIQLIYKLKRPAYINLSCSRSVLESVS